MRVIRKEFGSDYETYHFGYSIWAELEPGDELHAVYSQGFLPYSGKLESRQTLYMARSIRLALEGFQLNSENRRILRKADWELERESIPISEFDIGDSRFQDFCRRYFRDRHQVDIVESGKLEAVLEAGFLTDVVVYREDEDLAGYVLLVNDREMSHFWFSFYDTDLLRKSLGLWMMIQEAIQAREAGKSYLYLGTCYGDRALYKTNFNCTQWWNGNEWSSDIRELKRLARQESETTHR